MKWSDATTAQNPMSQFDAIISDAAFLFSSSRNIYEILLVFNDTVWILEKMFIMKLHIKYYCTFRGNCDTCSVAHTIVL